MDAERREFLAKKLRKSRAEFVRYARSKDLHALLADSEWRAQVEPQTMPRTQDMPPDAVAWEKVEGYGDGHPMWWRNVGGELLPDADAPDLMPDTPAPLHRAIVDLEGES